jgi:RimJ/RimL family protein N-acetyltransferase
VTHPYWPLFDLRLTSGDLELTPLRESDLAEVADVMPGDVELNPSATRYQVGQSTQRGVVVHQEYWRYYGTWTPQEWRLNFAVRRGGELLGLQELEGNEFPVLRTVDTSSWLVAEARGTGIGKRMRRAALALAFGPLEAAAAITSAWHDNTASLGVSRSIGYEPNGESFLARDGRADTLVHLRMTRERWLATGAGGAVTIEGFEPCRPFFGLGTAG